MKRNKVFLISVLLILVLDRHEAGIAWGVERVWTDESGKFSVRAELVEVRGDKVILRRQNGKQITMPLAKLSEKDHKFLAAPLPAIAPFGDKQAKAYQKAWADYLGTPVQITNAIGMKLNLIPPGEFTMGSPKSQPLRLVGETQKRVKISEPFYLGVLEVTQGQYDEVMESDLRKRKGSVKPKAANMPVVNLQSDPVEFFRKLSPGRGIKCRLPTEAEWEYACRAGTKTAWCFGDDESKLSKYAWFAGNSGYVIHEGGQKLPNAWGLYDMHGNVCELVENQKSQDDTPGGGGLSFLVVNLFGSRGGAFYSQPVSVRAANRKDFQPRGANYSGSGFRVVRTCDVPR